MKEANIRLFKQFLKFRGLEIMFPSMYKSYRFEDNPEDFDCFLKEVDSHHVIPLAFNVNEMKSNNNAFDSAFWTDLHKRWLKYMKQQSNHGYYQDEIKIPRTPVKNPDGSIHVTQEQEEPEHDPEQAIVGYDWSGLDLVPLKSEGRRQMDPPSPLEIRVCTKSGNTVVLSSHISDALVKYDLMTMEMQVDRRTNRLVFLFGADFENYTVRKYSTDLYSISHKNIIEMLQKYLNIAFDDKKAYYIKVMEKIWNKEHTRCAVIVTNNYIERSR